MPLNIGGVMDIDFSNLCFLQQTRILNNTLEEGLRSTGLLNASKFDVRIIRSNYVTNKTSNSV